MRIAIPEFSEKKELYAYLKQNKEELIRVKCLKAIKYEDVPELYYGCTEIKAKSKDLIGRKVVKMTGQDATLKEGEVSVKVLSNMAGWRDSHKDVLIPGCYTKTIKDKGASNKQLIYHLADHDHKTSAIVGGEVSMSTEEFDLSVFNIESDIKKSEALIGASVVKRVYDEKTYYLYLDDEIKNHSIGLRYVKIFLCVNSDDEEYEEELNNYKRYIKYVINKDAVEKDGFFWAVTEIQLLEYSAVLWGSSELTPTTEIGKYIEPSADDTQKQKEEAAKALQENQVQFYLNS